MRVWCNGSHRRLKISRLRACRFDSGHSHQTKGPFSIMDNTLGYELRNGGSILSWGTKFRMRTANFKFNF